MQYQSLSVNQTIESVLSSYNIDFTQSDFGYAFNYKLNPTFKSLHFDLVIAKNNFHLHAQVQLDCNHQELALLKFINFLNRNFIYANFAYSTESAALIYSVSVPFPNTTLCPKCITTLLSFPLLYMDYCQTYL